MQLGLPLCAILAINTYSAAMPIVLRLYASICTQAWLRLCMVEHNQLENIFLKSCMVITCMLPSSGHHTKCLSVSLPYTVAGLCSHFQ